MNITGTQLAMQYEVAIGRWPFIHDVEREYALPPFLLVAVGSRETNLDPYYVDHPGDGGHGRGLWQLDDRYHDIPDPFPVELQAVRAAELLRSLLDDEADHYLVSSDDLLAALNRYNSGSPLTSRTTGKDYGPDVLERREWLVAHYPYPPRGGPEMQEWMPGVRHVDRGGGVPVQDDGPTVIVLHTTETDGPASYNGTEPHFEVHDADNGTIQFVSLARTAKALYNAPGGGETNRRRGRIIQIEMVWRAGNASAMPVSLLARVARVIRFVREQFPDLSLVAPPQGFHGAEFGTIAIVDSPLRFSFPAWEEFGGICGHQHVPENDHWDPGRIPFDRLVSLVGGAGPKPLRPKEIDMYLVWVEATDDGPAGIYECGNVRVWQSEFPIVAAKVQAGMMAVLGEDGKFVIDAGAKALPVAGKALLVNIEEWNPTPEQLASLR